MNAHVIGGGLGGLACASLLARKGVKVVLHERASELGGRARSQIEGGFVFDQGPHAIYLGGAGESVLRELGVPLDGRIPDAAGSLALTDDGVYTLPVGMTSLLGTNILSMGEKMELGWLLLRLGRIDPATLTGTIGAWIEMNVHSERARRVVHAIFRLTTYTNRPDLLDARTAIARLQQATAHNVLYLHGGWQSITDALVRIAKESGVVFEGEAKELPHADAVVIAAGPRAAHALLPSDRAIAKAAETAVPARASALQVALRSLPNPAGKFALGIDRPHYVSVHSLTARVAPEGSHVVHVAKYGGDGTEAELGEVLEHVQPGWRERVVHSRFMPNLVVANAIARTFTAPDTPNVFIVGDWIANEAMLLDTVLASARAAAKAIDKENAHAA